MPKPKPQYLENGDPELMDPNELEMASGQNTQDPRLAFDPHVYQDPDGSISNPLDDWMVAQDLAKRGAGLNYGPKTPTPSPASVAAQPKGYEPPPQMTKYSQALTGRLDDQGQPVPYDPKDITTGPPQMKEPKWWQRALAIGAGGAAGFANAMGKRAPAIDVGSMGENILHPGYGEQMAEWKQRVAPLQAAAQIAQNQQQLGSQQQLNQAHAAYWLNRAQMETNRFKVDPKTHQVFDSYTGEIKTGAPTAKDLYDEAIAIGASPERAQAHALGMKEVVPKTPVEGELPLGEKVDQLNQMLSQRYQVLNPGKPLPAAYTVPVNATQKDYDRIEKSLSGEETANGTAATRASTDALRQQTLAIANENRANAREDKERKTVIGADPSTGKMVFASVADGKRLGLIGMMDAPAMETGKILSARQWLPLATAKANTPDKMGLLQIVDELDRRGALGAIASRWNDFLIGKWGGGSGDPQTDRLMEALKTKIGLSQTLLMNLHVGSRGGAYMLEHFEDLANAKKLNANILRTGLKSELNYAEDRAMLPSQGGGQPGDRQRGGQQAGGTGGNILVTAPDGSVHPFDTPEQANAFKKLAGIK